MADDTKQIEPMDLMSPPLVSIIIPCFNSAEFVAKSIESALCQTHPRVEVIVVDDGSDDESGTIIRRYPVLLIASERKGVSTARNIGARACAGEFLIFLDSDDRLLPGAAEAGLAALLAHPESSMAAGRHRFISKDGEIIRTCDQEIRSHDYYATLLRSNFIECPASAIYRRDAFLQLGGFNPELKVTEDYALYLRLARHNMICCHGAVIAEYRLHANSISQRSALMLTTTLQVIQSQRRYVLTQPRRFLDYLHGIWFWRRKYGRQLTRELALRETHEVAAWHWFVLARLYPPGFPIAIACHLLPRAGRRWLFRCIYRLRHPGMSLATD